MRCGACADVTTVAFVSVLILTVITETVTVEYLGCFKDNSNGKRLMTGYRQDFKHSLTPEKCVTVCKSKGLIYAGVQYGVECFCDNQQPPPSEAVPDSDCSKDCSGDASMKCGGDWRLNVYHAELTSTDTVMAYVGCFEDHIFRPRLMKGFQQNFEDSLTIQKCVNLCYNKGFKFAGMQYRVECFCDNQRPSLKDSADEGDCKATCSGDSSQICGGDWRLSVYETGIKEDTSLDLSESYIGCYKDQFNPRYLGGHFQNFPGNLTPQRCVTLCYRLGFLYAGLEYGSQCFCGDNHPSPTEKAHRYECSTKCAGDGSEVCGGSCRLSIYSTSITDVPEDGKLLGCYIDSLENRILESHKFDLVETNTPRRCLNLCLQKGYFYSGVQNSKECFCGNDIPENRRTVPDAKCDMLCSGDPSQTCGGELRLALYRTGGTTEYIGTKAQAPPLTSVFQRPISIPPTRTKQPAEEKSKTTFNGRTTVKGKVIFYDSFDGTSISQTNWQHTVKIADAPDFEFCVFTSDAKNLYLNNGQLVIKPSVFPDNFVKNGRLQLLDCTGKHGTKECEQEAKSYLILPPVQSARINTLKSFTFCYGIVEIIARMPVGDWLIPELWLEPKSKVYGPDYTSGQIRIAMSRGNQNLQLNNQDIGCKLLESGVIVGVKDNIILHTASKNNDGWYREMHNFTVVWTPDAFRGAVSPLSMWRLRGSIDKGETAPRNASVQKTNNMVFFVDGENHYSLLPTQGMQLSDVLGFTPEESRTWRHGTNLAPFDTEFYISLGLSAGGVRYFPDQSISNGRLKPWKNFEVKAALKFWQDLGNWHSTWNGEDAALHIDSVKVTAI